MDCTTYLTFLQGLRDICRQDYIKYVELGSNDALFPILHMYFQYRKYVELLIENQQQKTILED